LVKRESNIGGCDNLSHMHSLFLRGKLLFIGVASPAVLYLGWGLMEIVTIPAR